MISSSISWHKTANHITERIYIFFFVDMGKRVLRTGTYRRFGANHSLPMKQPSCQTNGTWSKIGVCSS